MNAETQALHDRLKAEVQLPDGWICEQGWPWRESTHLVAPKRGGGVVINDRHVHIELGGGEVVSPRVDVLDGRESSFKGRGWKDRIVEAARRSIAGFEHYDGRVGVQEWVRLNYRDLPGRTRYERLVEYLELDSVLSYPL